MQGAAKPGRGVLQDRANVGPEAGRAGEGRVREKRGLWLEPMAKGLSVVRQGAREALQRRCAVAKAAKAG